MEEQVIQIPDNFEVKEIKDNKIILVEKEKKLTYVDVANKLFPDGEMHYYIESDAQIITIVNRKPNYTCKNNANSSKQLEKLLAINMLMNVAKYLNDGWQPDWHNWNESKYYIEILHNDEICVTFLAALKGGDIYFKSKELAEKAIEILGEDTIRLALCTDY